MAAQTTLALLDGLATPVSRNFVPYQRYGGPAQAAVWLYKAGPSNLANVRIEIGMRRNSNGTTKIYEKVIVPYVTNDAVVGPKVVSKAIYDSSAGGFSIPDNVVQSQLDDLYAYVKNLQASTVVATWVKSLEAAN